jgi:hypothetical protein
VNTGVNLKDAQALIECEVDFTSSTGALRGVNDWSTGLREYTVYSYREPIARVTYTMTQQDDGDVVTERVLWITPSKFSVTTSKHTGIARRALRVI